MSEYYRKMSPLTREIKVKKRRMPRTRSACRGTRLAAEIGFEPIQTESESAVLPLHNSASATIYIIYYTAKKSRLFLKNFKKYCFILYIIKTVLHKLIIDNYEISSFCHSKAYYVNKLYLFCN